MSQFVGYDATQNDARVELDVLLFHSETDGIARSPQGATAIAQGRSNFSLQPVERNSKGKLLAISGLRSDVSAAELRFPTYHRGMLFHVHIPLSVFFVSIGKFSDLCHQTHFGL